MLYLAGSHRRSSKGLRQLYRYLAIVFWFILFWGWVPAVHAGDPAPAALSRTPPHVVEPHCPDPQAIQRPVASSDSVVLPILMYHHINNLDETAGSVLRSLVVSPEAFERQMAFLKENGYHTVYFDDVVAFFNEGRPLPEKPVVLTFDDAWVEQYTVAFPILRRYCHVATFLPPINWINSPVTLKWSQIEEMSRLGMEFGSHTVNHHLLTNQTPEQITAQLVTSKAILEQHIGHTVTVMAYPTGAVNASIPPLVSAAGYGAALGVQAGVRQTPRDLFVLHRTGIHYDDTLVTFASKLRYGVASTAAPPPAPVKLLSADPWHRWERKLRRLDLE